MLKHSCQAINNGIAFVLFGLFLTCLLNLGTVFLHHDRPFQLMSTQALRLNIVLNVFAPFILLAEYFILHFLSGQSILQQRKSPLEVLYIGLPVIPLTIGIASSVINFMATSKSSRKQIVNPFVKEANEDEQMLLASQMRGVPLTSEPIIEDRQAYSIINKHMKPINTTSLASSLIDILAALPWVIAVIRYYNR